MFLFYVKLVSYAFITKQKALFYTALFYNKKFDVK